MSSIMDIINQYAPQAEPTQTTTSLQSGGTGVVRQNQALVASQAGQQKAVETGATNLAMVGEQAQLQAGQYATASREQQMQYGMQNVSDRQTFETHANRVVSELNTQKSNLTAAEQNDKAAAAATFIRLQDTKYYAQLKQAGQMQRLDNANNFNLALKNAIFGEQIRATGNNVVFNNMLSQDDSEFRKGLTNMDIATAASIAHNELVTQREVSMYSGIAKTGGAAAGYAADSGMFDSSPTPGNQSSGNPSNQALSYEAPASTSGNANYDATTTKF